MATQFANGKIVTNGLVLCLDAADRTSYLGSGTTWFDLAGSNNGTLTNGPTFNSTNGGSIVFDGVDDYAVSNNFTSIATSIWSCVMFLKAVTSSVAVEGYCFGWDSSMPHGGLNPILCSVWQKVSSHFPYIYKVLKSSF
jgi:hypothetical protein